MASRYPFAPFPNGWFQVAYSDEIAAGQIAPLHYFGQELVLYRGASGEAHVLDAFCAHLGAHLGYGGRIEGDQVVCPFHAWRYDGSGACVAVPYAAKIPTRARIRAWQVCERNGLVMLWHDADGRPPAWEVPALPEVSSDEWTPYERRRWKIRVHNQDMAENAVDRAHFRYVHGTMTLPESRLEVEGPRLRSIARALLHTPRGDIEGQIDATVWGFGFSTTRFSGIVDTLLVSSVTPIDGEYVDTRFSFTVRKLAGVNAGSVGAALIRDIDKQMSEDIPIWENKAFIPRPVLCDGDGPIGPFRRWCRQFYSAEEASAAERAPGQAY
jgi:nitrite reductase/ring-hydroxylating ferredoxin subunit